MTKKSDPHPPGTEIPMHSDEALSVVLGLAGPHVKTEAHKRAFELVSMILHGRLSVKKEMKSRAE